jgi:uncharacterized Zn-finger protein
MAADKSEKILQVPVVEEQHQAVFRRAVVPEQVCCQALAEEFGHPFTLLPDGSLAPAAMRIERLKMGKIVMDRPKIGFRACPYCGARIEAAVIE